MYIFHHYHFSHFIHVTHGKYSCMRNTRIGVSGLKKTAVHYEWIEINRFARLSVNRPAVLHAALARIAIRRAAFSDSRANCVCASENGARLPSKRHLLALLVVVPPFSPSRSAVCVFVLAISGRAGRKSVTGDAKLPRI